MREQEYLQKDQKLIVTGPLTILKFIQYQNDRVNKKEITGAIVRNYFKSIKLFCEMTDLPIPWKKITRGLPHVFLKFSDYSLTLLFST